MMNPRKKAQLATNELRRFGPDGKPFDSLYINLLGFKCGYLTFCPKNK